MLKKWIALITLLLAMLLAAPAMADTLDYASLPAEYQAHFPEEAWSDASFLTYNEYALWSQYEQETTGKPWTTYPILSVKDDVVTLHIFSNVDGEVTLLTQTRADSGLTCADGYMVNEPDYLRETGENYRETINLYFNRNEDPWSIQYTFVCTNEKDASQWVLESASYQFLKPVALELSGESYNSLTVTYSDKGTQFIYANRNKPLDVDVSLPITPALELERFTTASAPLSPDDMFIQTTIDTKKHAKGGSVNFRKTATTKGKLLAKIPNGSTVRAIEIDDEWCYVLYNGQHGYVMSKFIKGTSVYEGK